MNSNHKAILTPWAVCQRQGLQPWKVRERFKKQNDALETARILRNSDASREYKVVFCPNK